jgi:hypothetical protein
MSLLRKILIPSSLVISSLLSVAIATAFPAYSSVGLVLGLWTFAFTLCWMAMLLLKFLDNKE